MNPNLFIKASSSSSLNNLGFEFPYCFKGVIVPTSTKPKPNLKRGLYTSAFLSNPAATPMGFEIFFPKISVSIELFFLKLLIGK